MAKMDKVNFLSDIYVPSIDTESMVVRGDLTVKGKTITEDSTSNIIKGAITVVNGDAIESKVTLMGQVILTGSCSLNGCYSIHFNKTLTSFKNFRYMSSGGGFCDVGEVLGLEPRVLYHGIAIHDNALWYTTKTGVETKAYDFTTNTWQTCVKSNLSGTSSEISYKDIWDVGLKDIPRDVWDWLYSNFNTSTKNFLEEGRDYTAGINTAYGMVYDPSSEAIRLGMGTYNSSTGEFSFLSGEGEPLAVRDLTTEDDGSFVMWDAENYCLVKAPMSKGDASSSIQQESCKAGGRAFEIVSARKDSWGYNFGLITLKTVEGIDTALAEQKALNKKLYCTLHGGNGNLAHSAYISMITDSENKVIQVVFYPWDFELSASSTNYLILDDYPELGDMSIGSYAVALGYKSSAPAAGALSAGSNTRALGKWSATFGQNTITGYGAFAANNANEARANNSAAFNSRNITNAPDSTAFGQDNYTYGSNSIVGGKGSRTYSKNTLAFGAGAIAGIKGFYWSKIDTTNKKIELTTKVENYGFEQDSNHNFQIKNLWAVGDIISIHDGYQTYTNCSKITAMSGKTITVDSLPFTATTNQIYDDISRAVYVCAKPSNGEVDFGYNSMAFGEGTRSITKGQFVVGKYNEYDSDALFVVGGGDANNNRANALVVRESGVVETICDLHVKDASATVDGKIVVGGNNNTGDHIVTTQESLNVKAIKTHFRDNNNEDKGIIYCGDIVAPGHYKLETIQEYESDTKSIILQNDTGSAANISQSVEKLPNGSWVVFDYEVQYGDVNSFGQSSRYMTSPLYLHTDYMTVFVPVMNAYFGDYDSLTFNLSLNSTGTTSTIRMGASSGPLRGEVDPSRTKVILKGIYRLNK